MDPKDDKLRLALLDVCRSLQVRASSIELRDVEAKIQWSFGRYEESRSIVLNASPAVQNLAETPRKCNPSEMTMQAIRQTLEACKLMISEIPPEQEMYPDLSAQLIESALRQVAKIARVCRFLSLEDALSGLDLSSRIAALPHTFGLGYRAAREVANFCMSIDSLNQGHKGLQTWSEHFHVDPHSSVFSWLQ